jgi:DNA (cytosine-5)-methyltransferase 1
MSDPLTFYEFFAGGGMARAGLGSGWRCAFANDIDATKAATYAANWGAADFVCADVASLSLGDLPGTADLAWASFPCQDLSLAGGGAGLGAADDRAATRSGAFWPFWRLMRGLGAAGRAPRGIVLENVTGALRSNGGRDFAALGAALASAGYQFGAVVIDAIRFVPQSRPRLFFLAFARDMTIPDRLHGAGPCPDWHPRALVAAQATLPAEAARA